MSRLFILTGSAKRDPAVEAWLASQPGELGRITRHWFDVVRRCGNDVQEVLHDGHPTACVGGAAFTYINAFKAHANLGFFHGAELSDPTGLLEGTGRFMRHVKIRPGDAADARALSALISVAYTDLKVRLERASGNDRQAG